ncbi:MAG TPA: hypothetical protein VG944_24570 [Fimbriimonas sp.]|nr:hypothetical protein [Fimbriimonas sp.]
MSRRLDTVVKLEISRAHAYGWLRFCLLLLFTLCSSPSWSQSTRLVPKWVTGGWKNYVVSYDGSTVLGWSSSNYQGRLGVFSTVDWSCLARVEFFEPFSTDPALSPSGDAVYYAISTPTTNLISQYAVATGVRTALPPREVAPITGLSVSHDGKELAYVTRPSSAKSTVVLYDLVAKKSIRRFTLSKPHLTYGVAFAAGDTRLIFDGPAVYDLSGKFLFDQRVPGDTSVLPHTVAVSPDQSLVFATSYGANATIAAYSVTGAPKLLWSIPSPLATTYSVSSSGDGKAVYVSGAGAGVIETSIWVPLDASTGAPLSQPNLAYGTGFSYPGAAYIACIPGTSDLLLGGLASNKMERWTFDPISQTAVFDGMPVCGGFLDAPNTRYPIFISYSTPSGKALFDPEDIFNPGSYLRDPDTGQFLTLVERDSSIFLVQPSPDGKYDVRVMEDNSGVNFGVTVYTFPAGGGVKGISIPGGFDRFQWSDEEHIWITDEWSVWLCKFVFPSLDLVATVSPDESTPSRILPGGIATTPDGNRLAISYANGITKIFELDTYTQIGTISGAGELQTAAGDLLGIHFTTGTTNTELVYDISSTPKIVRNIQYNMGSADAVAAGALSPDGSLVGLLDTKADFSPSDPRPQGTVRIYKTANGFPVRRWDNQFDLLAPGRALFAPGSEELLWGPATGEAQGLGGALIAAQVPPIVTSLTVTPSPVHAGDTATGTISLNRPAETTVTVLLSSNDASAQVPASVDIPTGSTQSSFTVATSAVKKAIKVTITSSEPNSGSTAVNLTLKP